VNLVFLGPPGSGKGTQAVRLSEERNLVHLSTGDLLREAVKQETDLGKKAREYMERGELVPDELIVGLIETRIAAGELTGGFIMDGFPRTVAQAEALKNMLVHNKINLDKAILLKVSDTEIVRRLSSRFYCPETGETFNFPDAKPVNGQIVVEDNRKLLRRPDDEPEVVRNRLEVYNNQTKPLEDFYRSESILAEIMAEDSPDNVFGALLEVTR
jgi:adenylate kinase